VIEALCTLSPAEWLQVLDELQPALVYCLTLSVSWKAVLRG
jgi:hypothetical protein